MDYLDFDLEISASNGSDYHIAVIGSPESGEAHEIMHFPFDQQALKNQQLTLQSTLLNSGNASGEQSVRSFGQTLFTALFTGKVSSLYAVSQSQAFSQNKGWRLKLRIQAPELAAVPWEFMYDPDQANYLCFSNNTSVVRYLDLSQPARPLAVTSPLNLLGITASPKDLPALDVEREKRNIEQAIEGLQAKGLVKLTWLQGRTWEDVQQAMRRGTWHIFHFIGHGGFNSNTNEGFIALEDAQGQAHRLSSTDLARLLTGHPSLHLVVLNSCKGADSGTGDIFSSTAATLVRRGIPAVLANQYDITDQAAIQLSSAFYGALVDGVPVDMAVSEARKAIRLGLTNTLEWGTPVLSMHAPDGILFELPQTAAKAPSTLDVAPSTSSSPAPSLSTPAKVLVSNSQAPAKTALQAKSSSDMAITTPGPFNGSPILSIGLVILIIAVIVGSVGFIAANRIAMDKVRTNSLIAATATAQSIATATTNPYPPNTGTLAIDDPLSKPFQWDVYANNSTGVACQFSNGAYHVSDSKPPAGYFCFNQVQYSNIAFEVQITIIHGNCGGIVFRDDVTSTNFYYFGVCVDGSYSLYVFLKGKPKTLVGKSSPAITTGLNQPNTIAVVANGSTLDLYVNHQKLTSVNDSTYSMGYLGLDAEATGTSTEVAFSNAKVWTL